MAEENVKVAVRLRPFNTREKDRKSELVISMEGNQTTIRDPKGEKEPKSFTFDHSYWSHDGFEAGENGLLMKKDDKYASQQDVFNDIGQGVLDNAYNGFNSTLFAYGQTGSGKSYSMVGYGPNKGIVPQAFEQLFDKIQKNEDPKIKYQVTFSMLEIYMEAVDDLLVSGKNKKAGGLKVRQNPKMGSFYVDGLSKAPVSSYEEISALMDKGTANRTVAATQMNATSSRAHTLVNLQFDQIITGDDGKKTTRQSTVNLVDLAGSERAGSTGATGARLKEGAQINKSLSALGNVISALASGKKAPFRDSVLTKLLQNALGGNSKTIMIAALSPAGINYDETLSTLRYADRAKQIKNKATVNESETDKLIRKMREENARLKALLESGQIGEGASTANMSTEEIAKMKKKMESEIRAQLKESEAATSRMDEDEYEKKLSEMRAKFEAENSKKDEISKKMSTTHHMKNINEDAALSGMVVHFFETGSNLIGRKGSKGKAPQIALSGLSIADEHAIVEVPADGGAPKLIQQNPVNADKMLLNGIPFTGEKELVHHDRLHIGTSHLYVYIDPKARHITADGTVTGWTNAPEDGSSENTLSDTIPVEIDWDLAQQEILANKQKNQDASLPQAVQDDLRELAPMIDEANAICHELEGNRAFEFVSLTGAIVGLPDGEARAMVKMTNIETDNEWMLNREDFEARRDRMQELYRKHKFKEEKDNGGDDDDDDDEDDEDEEQEAIDPFYHAPGEVVVGTTDIPLDCLAYNLDFDDDQFIQDYTGRNQGTLAASIFPCTADGTIDNELRENPDDALGKPMHFRLSIKSATFKNPKWNKQRVSYKHSYVGEDEVTTEPANDSISGEAIWNHSKVVSIANVDAAVMTWIQEATLTLVIKSWQSDDPKSMNRRKTQVPTIGVLTFVDEYREGKRGAKNTIDAIEAIIQGKAAIPAAKDESTGNDKESKDSGGKHSTKLEGELSTARDQIQTKDEEIVSLTAKVAEVEAELKRIQTEKQQKIDAAASSAGASDEDLRSALSESQSMLNESKAKVGNLTQQLEIANEQLKKVRDECSALKAQGGAKAKSSVCVVM